jgi:hypothetical protein
VREGLLEPEALEIQQRERFERAVRESGADSQRGAHLLRKGGGERVLQLANLRGGGRRPELEDVLLTLLVR